MKLKQIEIKKEFSVAEKNAIADLILEASEAGNFGRRNEHLLRAVFLKITGENLHDNDA